MKLPLQIKDRNGLTVDVLDANGELVTIVSNNQGDAAQIVSAVNRHKELVNALECAVTHMEKDHVNTPALCRATLLAVLHDAVPHVSKSELEPV